MDRAQLAAHLIDERCDRRAVGDVATSGDDLRAQSARLCRHLLQFVHLGAGADRQVRAFTRVCKSRKSTHVATGACYENGLALKPRVHEFALSE